MTSNLVNLSNNNILTSRFGYWLKRAFPSLNAKVVNFAIPATNSQVNIDY